MPKSHKSHKSQTSWKPHKLKKPQKQQPIPLRGPQKRLKTLPSIYISRRREIGRMPPAACRCQSCRHFDRHSEGLPKKRLKCSRRHSRYVEINAWQGDYHLPSKLAPVHADHCRVRKTCQVSSHLFDLAVHMWWTWSRGSWVRPAPWTRD